MSNGCYFSNAKAFSSYYDAITDFVSRLSGVVIENMDALPLMPGNGQAQGGFYCDPPYLSGTKDYRCNFSGRHEELCRVLKTLKAHVVLSGYDNEIYRDMLPHWHIVNREALCFAGKKKYGDALACPTHGASLAH